MARGSWSDDFRSKYGFGDGSTYEDRDFKARALIVKAINKLTAFKKAKVKAIEYDRSGMHNPCMVLLISAGVSEREWMAAGDGEAREPEDIDFDEIVARAYDRLDRKKR